MAIQSKQYEVIMFYRVIFLAALAFPALHSMQKSVPASLKPTPIDHFANRLDCLIRQDRGNEIISMYEEHPEKRAGMRELIEQKKPLLLKAFDAVEQAERKEQAQKSRDAFDVLNEQHEQNFQQEFAQVQKIFQTTGSIKPAEELAKRYRTLAAPANLCNGLDLFIAQSKAAQQKSIQPLLDFQRSHHNLTQKEQKEWQEILDVARQQFAAPSAPLLEQPEVREPDAHYQDILIPYGPARNAPMGGKSVENEAVKKFLLLNPQQKDEVLEDLIKRRDLLTLRVLKQQLPGFKKIDEALELIEVMQKSAQEIQQPQPLGKKSADSKKLHDGQDANAKPGMLTDVRTIVAQNPVESAVVATTVVGLIAYAWRKARSD